MNFTLAAAVHNPTNERRRRRRRMRRKTSDTVHPAVQHWDIEPAIKNNGKFGCLHPVIFNACEVNLGKFGFTCALFSMHRMWPLIVLYRDNFLFLCFRFDVLYVCLFIGSVRFSFTITRWIYLFRSSFMMIIIPNTIYATKLAFIKHLEKNLFISLIYFDLIDRWPR